MERFTTAAEAKAQIAAALGDFAEDHDIDAIFDDAYAWDAPSADKAGFIQTVTTDEFWTIAEKHSN